jgi:hypothetical protein
MKWSVRVELKNSLKNKMDNIKFYTESQKYLIKKSIKSGVTREELDDLINGNYIKKPMSLSDVFKRLIITLQNYQGMKNFIGYYTRNKSSIEKTFFDFDIKLCIQNYRNDQQLFDAFIVNGCNMMNSESSWRRYARNIIRGLNYLSKFESLEKFNEEIKKYKDNPVEYPIKLTKRKDKFLGFALACDWLKELGFLEYNKPDVHIKAIINKKLIQEYSFRYDSLSLSNEDYFREISQIAKDNGVTPFAIDKLLWLICSGDYHEPINKKVIPLKNDYLAKLSEW